MPVKARRCILIACSVVVILGILSWLLIISYSDPGRLILSELNWSDPAYALGGKVVACQGMGFDHFDRSSSGIWLTYSSGRKVFYPLPNGSNAEWASCDPSAVTSTDSNLMLFSNHSTDLFEIDLRTGKTRKLYSADDNICQAAYSPDSNYVAVIESTKGNRTTLRILSKSTRKLRKVGVWPDETDGNVQLVKWSNDNRSIFCTKSDKHGCVLLKCPIDGQAPRVLVKFTGNSIDPFSLRVSPNEKEITYSNSANEAFLSTLLGYNPRKIASFPSDIHPYDSTISPSGRYIAIDFAPGAVDVVGIRVIDTKTGRGVNVKGTEDSRGMPRISFVMWHPKEDKFLAYTTNRQTIEVYKYDAKKLF